jgi:elongation factor 1-beta
MLQITLVMEDKISLDDLQEEIAEFEDYVQSTDVASSHCPSTRADFI